MTNSALSASLVFAVPTLLAALASACGGGQAPASSPGDKAGKTATTAGRMGSHGMVAFGTPEHAFVSHIPMFGPPHDIQAIVAGSFHTQDNATLPASFGDRLFTFLPDRMSLDRFLGGSLGDVGGQIFLGNFEAGGQPLPSHVRFVATRVVHQHVLDAGAKSPSKDLTYFLVGSHDQAFALHKITASPGFDDIVAVKLGADGPPDADLAASVEFTVPETPDDASHRLGLALGKQVSAARAGQAFAVTPTVGLSCLVGPEFSEACPSH